MRFLVLGAGKMGRAVVYDLCKYSPEAQLIVVDSHAGRLEWVTQQFPDERISVIKADVTDLDELSYILSSADVVISCVNSKFNYNLAKASIEAGASFCDLGGNEDVVRKQFLLDEMARERNVAIIPDCGLAPGMVSILASAAYNDLDETNEIAIRVGGLPVEPRAPLNYAQTFSVDGLIDEYLEDATVISDGRLLRVPSLSGLEEMEFDEPFGNLEAFYVSGGISTLPATFGNKVRSLNFKTIRYPGHCEKMKLLKDLGFMDSSPLPMSNPPLAPRTVLAQLLEHKLPKEEPDVVLMRVDVRGKKGGEDTEIRWQAIDYMDEENNLSAMMRNSAFPVSIIAQMIGSGEIKEKGALYQELHVPVQSFLGEITKRGIELTRIERALVKGN